MAWAALRNQIVIQVASITAGLQRVSPPVDTVGLDNPATTPMRSPLVVGGQVLKIGPSSNIGLVVGDTVYFQPFGATVLDDVTVVILDSQIEIANR